MKRIMFFLFATACAEPVDAPMPDDGPEPTTGVLQDPTDGPRCPELIDGVVPCSSLAVECQTLAIPGEEAGLHCLPEYIGDPSVPCFCVGATTPDSWCLRDV